VSALATLARVARRKAEEIERALAALEERRAIVERRVDAHDRTVAGEQATAAGSVDAAIAFGAYAQLALAQRRGMASERDVIANEANALRDALREAFIELKKIETLIAQDVERVQVEEGRREQAQMDDLAANMSRRQSS